MYGHNGMQGFADLGSILAGGANQSGQEQFTAGATKLAQMDEALTRARSARAKMMAREQAREKLVGIGMDPNQADLLSNIMLGETGSDFNAGMSGMETQQQMTARSGALDEMQVLVELLPHHAAAQRDAISHELHIQDSRMRQFRRVRQRILKVSRFGRSARDDASTCRQQHRQYSDSRP